jgi:hypothetical protein
MPREATDPPGRECASPVGGGVRIEKAPPRGITLAAARAYRNPSPARSAAISW